MSAHACAIEAIARCVATPCFHFSCKTCARPPRAELACSLVVGMPPHLFRTEYMQAYCSIHRHQRKAFPAPFQPCMGLCTQAHSFPLPMQSQVTTIIHLPPHTLSYTTEHSHWEALPLSQYKLAVSKPYNIIMWQVWHHQDLPFAVCYNFETVHSVNTHVGKENLHQWVDQVPSTIFAWVYQVNATTSQHKSAAA